MFEYVASLLQNSFLIWRWQSWLFLGFLFDKAYPHYERKMSLVWFTVFDAKLSLQYLYRNNHVWRNTPNWHTKSFITMEQHRRISNKSSILRVLSEPTLYGWELNQVTPARNYDVTQFPNLSQFWGLGSLKWRWREGICETSVHVPGEDSRSVSPESLLTFNWVVLHQAKGNASDFEIC